MQSPARNLGGRRAPFGLLQHLVRHFVNERGELFGFALFVRGNTGWRSQYRAWAASSGPEGGKLTTRYGKERVMMVSGILRTSWSIGLAFIPRGGLRITLVMAIQFAIVRCMGVFNSIYAALRLESIEKDQAAVVLAAWSISSNAAKAILTVLFGVVAQVTSARMAIALAGIALVATPLLLPCNKIFASSGEGSRAT